MSERSRKRLLRFSSAGSLHESRCDHRVIHEWFELAVIEADDSLFAPSHFTASIHCDVKQQTLIE